MICFTMYLIIMPKNNKPELVIWQRFNRLVILWYSHQDNRRRKFYNTKCDCWKEKSIMGSAMLSWNTKSCWCFSTETRENKRISENHTEITAIMLWYKRHAERRWFKRELDRWFVENIVKQNCFYCWTVPSNIKKTKNSIWKWLLYSWLDRVDSKKDYTCNNVVPCCRTCNYAKSNLSLEEFRERAIKIWNKAMATQRTALPN